MELFLKRQNIFENKIPERKKIDQSGTGIEESGCQISKNQDQSSPTEHSHIIPWTCSEEYFYKEEGSTVAFERFRNTRHQVHVSTLFFVCFWRSTPPQWARASSFTMFLDHTQRRTTVGRTPLDEWSARRRDLYVTTQNTHNRQISMPRWDFEPTVSAGERPQTYALDRAATGTDLQSCYGDEIRRDEMGETCFKHVIK